MLKNKKFLFLAAFLAFALLFVAACGNGDDDDAAGDNGDDAVEDVADDNGDDDDDNDDVADDNGDDDDGDDNGAAAGGAVGASGEPDELIVGFTGEVPTLDPHAANLSPAAQMQIHTMNRLLYQAQDMSIHPELALSWESVDDYSYRFHLRDDVYFQNGNKLTAYDVEFSLIRGSDAPSVEPVIGMIDPDRIVVEDDYTIVIGTEEPFGPFLAHLAHTAASIMCREAIGDVEPGEAGYDVVGSGPFQIYENIAGDRLVMERWDDYHGEAPNMRLITFRVMTDPQTRSAAIETGEVDLIYGPAPTDIERLENDPSITIHEVMGLGTEYIMLNNNIIDDVRVRQAINYALDTYEIVNITTAGTAFYASGFINPITFAHDPDFEPYPFDLDRARELMVEAGHSGEAGAGDLEFTILSNGGNTIRNQAAEIVANQLNEIGIDLTIELPEFATMMEEIEEGNVAMATLGWLTVTADPDYALFPLFHSSAVTPSTNHAQFVNAEFDDLIERARASQDPDERVELYHEAQLILREYAPWVLLSNNSVRVPVLNNVRGFIPMPATGHFFGSVYFE